MYEKKNRNSSKKWNIIKQEKKVFTWETVYEFESQYKVQFMKKKIFQALFSLLFK